MKKTIILSLAVFWIVVLSLLGKGLGATKKNNVLELLLPVAENIAANSSSPGSINAQVLPENTPPGANTVAPSNAAGTTSNVSGGNILSAQAVAAHNSANNCWMIISGNVYNLTTYLPNHPGGPATMIPYCGKDATAGFITKDVNPGKPHSQNAQSMLAPFYVGTLGQNMGGGAVSNSSASSAGANLITSASKTSPISTLPRNLNTTTPTPTIPLISSPSPTPAPTQNLSQTPNPAPTPSPTNQPTLFTSTQVATHSSASSCWIIVNNKAYDITSYLPYHPGGINAILPYCGKDGTGAFVGLPHSQNAASLLASYYVGNLSSSSTLTPTSSPNFTPQPIPGSTPQPMPSPSRTPRPSRDDDDD